MTNLAMQRKLNNGGAIDLKDAPRWNKWYILDRFIDDIDYCDSSTDAWIWSIGKRKLDGMIFASTTTEFYQNPQFECLWLR